MQPRSRDRGCKNDDTAAVIEAYSNKSHYSVGGVSIKLRRLIEFVYSFVLFPFKKVRHSEVYIFRSILFCGKISEVFTDFNEIVNSNTPRARVRSCRRFVRNTERDTVLTSYSIVYRLWLF